MEIKPVNGIANSFFDNSPKEEKKRKTKKKAEKKFAEMLDKEIAVVYNKSVKNKEER
jgi:hypothetical protein